MFMAVHIPEQIGYLDEDRNFHSDPSNAPEILKLEPINEQVWVLGYAFAYRNPPLNDAIVFTFDLPKSINLKKVSKMRVSPNHYMGFCRGVERSIDTANSADEPPFHMLERLIHNNHVMRKLEEEKDIRMVSDLRDFDNGTLIISAHGAGPDVKRQAEKQGLKVIDTTCAVVTSVHKRVKSLNDQGYLVIIIGDKNHAEVKGIQAWAGGVVPIVTNVSEVDQIVVNKKGKMAVVSQTTQDLDIFKRIVTVLRSKWPNIEIFNTICKELHKRHLSLKQLSKENEVIIIIGDRGSANTHRLNDISKAINPNTYFIDNVSELDCRWFKDTRRVGIASGTSTPDWIIEEVKEELGRLGGS